VTSLYYDTADLRFYWEKIEGSRFRRKLRMRLYGEPSECGEHTPVQIEIKQRVNYWVADLTAGLNMSVIRLPKYCQCPDDRTRWHSRDRLGTGSGHRIPGRTPS